MKIVLEILARLLMLCLGAVLIGIAVGAENAPILVLAVLFIITALEDRQ